MKNLTQELKQQAIDRWRHNIKVLYTGVGQLQSGAKGCGFCIAIEGQCFLCSLFKPLRVTGILACPTAYREVLHGRRLPLGEVISEKERLTAAILILAKIISTPIDPEA